MRILYLNAGNETGGGMFHILHMLTKFKEDSTVDCVLGVMEKKELYKRAIAGNISTIHFDHTSKWSIPLLQKMIRFIKINKITHVHTHGPRANVYMNMIKKKVNIPWIVTVHSDPFIDFQDQGIYGKLLTKVHIQAIKNADKVISVSNAIISDLLNAGINEEKIAIIHNGIEFMEEISTEIMPEIPANIRAELGFSEEDFLFIKVARLESVKGHSLALRAFAQLLDQMKGRFHLLLIGDGTMRESLEQFAKDLNIQKNVHFLGEKQDIDRYYEAADVTLLTSISESFPYVLLESARAKTPIISTNVGDVEKLLYKDELGWKVATCDVDGLVEAMKEAVYLHSEGLKMMGKRLYSYASHNFSLDKCANEVYNVYKACNK
ncbi:glycosyltransferase family 4 protein [Pseudogracilibacillus sp. SE30717A]|uniref:glycosyltransferase family 4 protein n=1 Tax=Pseudogracilibacillus sp. SE30717A TaxID=3098293 RepID=UPI00300E1B7F